MKAAKKWETRTVRAYNLRPSDVIDGYDIRRHRAVRMTVQWVDTNHDSEVHVGFRRRMFGWKVARLKLIHIRRMVEP